MSALAVPFHFTTTFLVAVGAYAGVWLAISRPAFCPRGWPRAIFGLGWALLALAETVHGAQIVTSDIDTKILALRVGAYFLLALSLAAPAEDVGGKETAGEGPGTAGWTPAGGSARRGLWATSFSSVGRAVGPAVLALGAAVLALRSRLEGARRLALALALLGTSELFLARGGGAGQVDSVWVVAHGLYLLGGIALGAWLWRAFRVSIQARFVAALVLLLLVVITLISSTVTSVFAASVRQDAYRSATSAASFETLQFSNVADNLRFATSLITVIPGLSQLVADRSDMRLIAEAIQTPANQTSRADFLAFFGQDGSPIGVSAKVSPGGPDTLTPGELVALTGTAEVRGALNGSPVASIDDIGLGQSKLVAIGASPVTMTVGGRQTVVGAVAAGKIINSSFLKQLPLPGAAPLAVIDLRGNVLASTFSGADLIARKNLSEIKRRLIDPNGSVRVEASIGRVPYYVAIVSLTRPLDRAVIGGLVVLQPQTLGATQRGVSRTLFLGALAATLFAVGASSVSGSRITRPIRDLTAAAERVRQGDLSARVSVTEADEVGALAEAFNQMTTSLDSAAGELREAALQESRLRGELETILQSMTDGLIAVDRGSKILTINREAERILSVSADRARGKRIEDVLSLTDSMGAQVDLPVYRLGAGSSAGFVGPFDRDGNGTAVAVTSAPITDKAGSVSGAVAVLRDLTSEMEVEQMKTEFLSNISHELRTPLTPIKGYADLLRRKVVPRQKSISFLNVIVASTERMERIVDMLVDFSAMQAGRLVVRTAAFELDRATADLVAKWREAAPNHTFERSGFDSLPPVAGDGRLLPRAIDELIDNAVKFSPDGGEVTVRGEMDPHRPDRVRVSVTDHGIGISTEQISHIFQDFVQVDASETRAFGGLGLGLAYVRRIIEAHDGELEVQSKAGQGSVFTLLIPLQRGGDAPGGKRVATETPVPVVPLRRSRFVARQPPAEWPGGR